MKKLIQKAACFLLAFPLFSMTAYAKPDWPKDTGIQAEAGIVMDVDSGTILYGQNIHLPYAPASITKILTALVVLENCELNETVTYSETAVNSVEADSGNKLGNVAGDQLTVEDCLYGLLLESSNQTANALAEHAAGSIEDFVILMNEKIKELGCEESNFENPSGLNGENQFVSAYDMALIAKAAFSNETLLEISSTTSRKLAGTTNYPGGYTVTNEHRMLKSGDEFYYEPARAGKTGYLAAAGNTLVTYAEKDGRRLISVILKGQPRQYWTDTRELLDFGFRSFQNGVLADMEGRYVTGDEVLNLDRGAFRCSDLRIDPSAQITLPHGASLEDADLVVGSLPEDHPERAVAQMTYTYNDRIVGTAYLLAKEGVALPDASETAPDASQPTEDGSAAESLPAGENPDGNPEKEPGRSVTATVTVIASILAIGLLAAATIWISWRKKKEAEELARRRERRRQRLQQSGEEEEFERLLAEWKNKKH